MHGDGAHVRNNMIDKLREGLRAPATSSAVGHAIRALRETPYSLAEFMDDCATVKETIARDSASAQETLLAWTRLDQIVRAALQATSSVHETVLETCGPGYAELDSRGRVLYANRALLEFCPQLIGQTFADAFVEVEQVRTLVDSATRRGPFRLVLQSVQGKIPVNTEFGPVADCEGPVAHYSLVADIRAHVDAQTAGLEAAPFGVVRIDRNKIIQFINRRACEVLRDPTKQHVGKSLAELFPASEQPRLGSFLEPVLEGGEGFPDKFEVLVADRRIQFRLFAFPEFNPQQQQTGALVFFRSAHLEDARLRMYRACERYRQPEEMLKEILSILKDVLPFDQAFVGLYTREMTYYRVLVADPDLPAATTTRWSEVPREFAEWIMNEETWAPDLEEFLKGFATGEEVRQRPLVEELIKGGIKSFISFPVRQNERVTAVLSLLSRTAGQYHAHDLNELKQLPVEQALRMAREGTEQRRLDFVRETLQLFADAKGHRQVARIVVTQLATEFEWDHVSIFTVNRISARFELLEQFARVSGAFALPPDYSQPLTDGLLGKALREERLQVIDDTAVKSPSSPYIALYQGARSALCVPIRLDGTICWMLNIETSATHAFRGTDLEAVQAVVGDLTRTLDQLFQANLTEEILDLTDQGIVIVNALGRIRNVNRAAEGLLGGTKDLIETRPFLDFAGPGSETVLAERSSTVERHVELRDLQDNPRPAIVSLRRPSEGYDHKIWLLTDTLQRDWNVERRYLRETVHDVAQQTRVPLMVAGSLVRRVTRLLHDEQTRNEVAEVLDKAMKQLGKAEITYERLIGGLSGRRSPGQARTPIDLAESLKGIFSELPREDLEQIKSNITTAPTVRGEQQAIDFVLKSIIFYLLRKKPIDRTIEVRMIEKDHGVRLEMLVSDARTESVNRPRDVVSKYEDEARTTAALAPEAIRSVLEAHGGKLDMPNADAATMRFELWLPAEAQSAPMVSRHE